MSDEEFLAGYLDGRNPAAPEPSDNRSERYRHSFAVGRAELAGEPIPAETSRRRAREAEERDNAR